MSNSIKNQKKQLQSLLKKKTDLLYAEAIESEGRISASGLEELAGIEKLINSFDNNESSASSVRWQFITLLLVTLTIVSILLFARVCTTEIDLELSLSEAGFRLSKTQVLSGLIQLSSLGVSGMEEIHLPRSEQSESRIFKSDDGTPSAIKLIKDSTNSKNESSLTLSPLMLQKGNYVWLQPDVQTPNQYQVSIRSSGLDFQAAVLGNVTAGMSGSPKEKLIFKIPGSVEFVAGKGDADLTVEPLPQSKTLFQNQLFIDSLSMFHIDEYSDDDQTLVRQVSTVIAGTLYYQSLGGTEYKLRPDQEIYFKKLRGFIRAMEIKDGRIALLFHGTVSGMDTGGDDNRISLMPTYLDWLKARHSLSLLWGTTLYFFGLLIGLINWWKKTK